MNEPETLQRYLDTRLLQLNTAMKLDQWQEAYRSIEDLHNLLSVGRKAPKPSILAQYYERLSEVFLIGGNHLIHAAGLGKLYAIKQKSLTGDDLAR